VLQTLLRNLIIGADCLLSAFGATAPKPNVLERPFGATGEVLPIYYINGAKLLAPIYLCNHVMHQYYWRKQSTKMAKVLVF
jgi:hypothetical protein